MGITLREIVFDIGGGIVDGRPFKAVQTGGPSGGCIPAELPRHAGRLRVARRGRLDHGLRRHDRAWTTRTCMVDVARYFMDFCRDESCGKCIPCRVGTTQMLDAARRDLRGPGDARRSGAARGAVRSWCSDTSLCGLGQTAPNPVFSTLRYFRDEYVAHIDGARICPAGVCADAPGTAASVRMTTVHTLHDRRRSTVAGAEGQTILEVAREAGIGIPTLCHLDGLSRRSGPAACAWSRCAGSPKLVPACMTPVEEGMEVTADAPSGCAEYRRDDRRAAVRRAQPRLRGLRRQRPLRAAGPGRATSALDPLRPAVPCTRAARSTPATTLFAIDHNRCILCTRCVRVCDEIEGAHTWDVMGRGIDARVVTDLGHPVGRVDRPARAAASACRSARPARCSRRAESIAERREGTATVGPPLADRAADGPTAHDAGPRLATVWLDGCSGCHMSFLDLDERLIELIASGPTSSTARSSTARSIPTDVDVCLVEGAVSSEDDLHRIQLVRARTRTLVSFGDCAVTTTCPGMRNPIGPMPCCERAYVENVTLHPGIPTEVVPRLLPIVRCRCTRSCRSTCSCPAARRRRT